MNGSPVWNVESALKAVSPWSPIQPCSELNEPLSLSELRLAVLIIRHENEILIFVAFPIACSQPIESALNLKSYHLESRESNNCLRS